MASALKRFAPLAPTGARMGSATAGKHAQAHAKMWERLTLFGALPIVAVASYLVFDYEKKHEHPPPEFKEYDHLRIRRKNFPWGDGKHSLFHNPETNPIPGVGYEKEWHPKH